MTGRKSQIIALDKGYTWYRIIRDIFPPFRNARMAIVCHERPERIPVNVERLSFDYSLPVREPVSSFPMNTAENRRRVIAIKTNLLFVAALTANLGFEAELWPHWSIDLPVWYSPYDITSTRKLRLLAGSTRSTVVAGSGYEWSFHRVAYSCGGVQCRHKR